MEESVGPAAGMAARANREQSFQGHQHENKILLILTLIIGSIVGLVVGTNPHSQGVPESV